MELEDSRSVAVFYSNQEILEEHIDNPSDELSKIDRVGVDDVLRVARKYLVNKGLNLAVIGNFADKKRFEELLKVNSKSKNQNSSSKMCNF